MEYRTLEEENGHTISFSEHGNPEGAVVLSFHGGPGSKSRRRHAERFDLTKYRVIFFDQRGCGKSTPMGELAHNTTQETLHDAERIRRALGIETWFVSGSSWGSTLSLLYAITHPERVRGILLSAVFLADRDSVAWAMDDPKGVARLMPDVWARRMAFFERFGINLDDQNAGVLRALEKATPQEQHEIAAGVENWEGNLASVQGGVTYKHPDEVTEEDIAGVKIFCHYELHKGFLTENYILQNVTSIEHLPIVIVHGRYDILCTLQKAHLLAKQLPKSELIIANSSGHAFTAEGTTILELAFDRFLERHT